MVLALVASAGLVACSAESQVAPVAAFGPQVWQPSDALQSFCTAVEALPCAGSITPGSCAAQLGIVDRGATAVGCGAVFQAAFGCMADHQACPDDPDVVVDLEATMVDSAPYCAAQARSSFACLADACIPDQPVCQEQGDGCAVQVGASCGSSGALCSAADGHYACECAGAPGGRVFALHTSNCCDGVDWVLGACGVQP